MKPARPTNTNWQRPAAAIAAVFARLAEPSEAVILAGCRELKECGITEGIDCGDVLWAIPLGHALRAMLAKAKEEEGQPEIRGHA